MFDISDLSKRVIGKKIESVEDTILVFIDDKNFSLTQQGLNLSPSLYKGYSLRFFDNRPSGSLGMIGTCDMNMMRLNVIINEHGIVESLDIG